MPQGDPCGRRVGGARPISTILNLTLIGRPLRSPWLFGCFTRLHYLIGEVMLTGLDHIIIGVTSLEQATTTFSQKLGLAVTGGGVHPFGGTANRVVVIGDTYLELITVRTPLGAQGGMGERLGKGDVCLNFCVFSNYID